MNSYFLALGLAALPAASNVVGGLLVDVLPTTKRMLGLVLHIAVGVLLAITTLELLPRIIQADPVWGALLALLTGGGAFIGANQAINHLSFKRDPEAQDQIAWIIFFSTSIHLLGGGLMLGASVTIDQQLGWVLSLSRMVAHVPQGFATLAEFWTVSSTSLNRLSIP